MKATEIFLMNGLGTRIKDQKDFTISVKHRFNKIAPTGPHSNSFFLTSNLIYINIAFMEQYEYNI